jgi:glycosyltransferase involved in cell wall biosynthesis
MSKPPKFSDAMAVNVMVKPLVSFVIPVLNGERDIARCLLSIRQLQFPREAYELLIMDNGSTDGTHQILCRLQCAFEVVPQVNVSTLRNRGAMTAGGEYVAFIDADMELPPCWLEKALAGFEDQRVVASGCFPGIPEDATWVQRTWNLQRRCRQSAVDPTPVPWLGSANLIVRRDAFLAVGGFNEDLPTAEDVDLCYRLAHQGTVLHNPAMAAIHWGEDPDLQTFWRKEVWRGIGNLKGVLSHGFRWDELPSLGYPLYVMVIGLLCCLSAFVDIWLGQILFTPVCCILLVLPAILLSLKTARLSHCVREVPKLFLLYFIYGLARAYSTAKIWTI